MNIKKETAFVVEALNHVNLLDKNVTKRLRDITDAINKTEAALNSAVLSAKESINDEVHQVQTDMAQYIATTNNQFNSENDFVKFQLAGHIHMSISYEI